MSILWNWSFTNPEQYNWAIRNSIVLDIFRLTYGFTFESFPSQFYYYENKNYEIKFKILKTKQNQAMPHK